MDTWSVACYGRVLLTVNRKLERTGRIGCLRGSGLTRGQPCYIHVENELEVDTWLDAIWIGCSVFTRVIPRDPGRICVVSGYIREVERYLDDRERFGRESLFSKISCGDLHVGARVPYLRVNGVEGERDDVASGIDLNIGVGRKGEVGGGAREFDRYRVVEGT